MKKLEVPFYSQFADVTLTEWQERACAPTCLKMVIDYLSDNNSKLSTDDLIKEGLEIGAYQDGVGWIHAGLLRIAHNHGICGYNEEFRSRDKEFENILVEKGIEKIRKTLESDVPVIISCSKNFDEVHKFHQVVIVGFDENGFYYHEPHEKDSAGANRFVDAETFRTHWRKFAIFLSK